MADPTEDHKIIQIDDNDSRSAIKVVVDEAMRMDKIGPVVLGLLEQHHQVIQRLTELHVHDIKDNATVQEALFDVIDKRATQKVGLWAQYGLKLVVGCATTAAVSFAVGVWLG